MLLQELEDLVMMNLKDEDLYPVFRVLWSMRTKEIIDELRGVMTNTLIFRKNLLIKENVYDFILNRLKKFRFLLNLERNLAPEEGKRSYALVTFAHCYLDLTYDMLRFWIKKAKEEGSEQAIFLLAKMTITNKEATPNTRKVAANTAIKELGLWKSGDLAVYADKESGLSSIDSIQKGADAGNPLCCSYLAKELLNQKRYEGAIKYIEQAVYTGNPDDIYNYALTYIGEGFKRVDYKRGKELMIKAAYAGSANAAAHLGKCALWGEMYAEGKIDFYEAEKYLMMADKFGHMDAGYFLGSLYFGHIKDTPTGLINKEIGVSYWEKLAKKNQSDSLLELGCLHYNGDMPGYEKDELSAAAYFRRAGDHGSCRGALYYAEMITEKEIEVSDHAILIKYLLIAMSSSSPETAKEAKDYLVHLYREGNYLKKDEDWANIIENYSLPIGKKIETNHNQILDDFDALHKKFKEEHKRELDFVMIKT